MDPRREQARRVFLQLGELPAAERAAALTRACSGDADLRAEVEALLRAERDAGAFLSSPTAAPPSSPSSAADLSSSADVGEQAGAQIGRYKLLEQIGEGGMGTIWMAEQREPVKRRVALKIIKLGMDTRQVIARFEAERQALALMDHPHIAKVLDAGATETGRPYFVMEYIKGVPILEYCDQSRLDTKARLELFTSVCHAIQHAHQKGIIHRDIKPSNVLVTLHDGVPVPKVIDFGIAKATNSELTTKTLFTEHRQMIGTPAYMSPEQAEMSGLDIDTRSDVYSLGVLLYELLTGTTPFDTRALLESGFEEMLRAIREDEPHKPSTRVSSLGDTGTRTAQRRRVELKGLSLLLRGDLDWIVMKCLEKDRTRRYETANGLAADIKRHLADEPVTAGAPSAGYKLRKFVKRNRARVIAASVVLVSLLVAIVGTSWGLVEKSRARSVETQRRLEDEQRSVAEEARLGRNAEAVSSLLCQCEDALRAGAVAKARVAMDAARKRAAEGGAERDAERLARLARDLEVATEFDAIDQYRWTWKNNDFAPTKVVAKRMGETLEKFGADPEVASIESAFVAVNGSAVRERIVVALDWQLWSRHSEAVRALLRRLDADPFRNEVRDSLLAQNTKVVDLANQPAALEQPPEFAAFLGVFNQIDEGRRIEMMKAAVLRRPRDMGLLMTLNRLCRSDMPERLRWMQAAVAAEPTNMAAYGNLGVILKDMGRVDEALACYHKTIALDPSSAAAYLNLGNALGDTGHFEEALVNHKKAIELDPNEFENYCCQGNTLGKLGRFDEAIVSIEKAIELNPEHIEARHNLGWTLLSQGKPAEAIQSFKKIIELDPKQSDAYGNIGVALRDMGRLDESVGYFEKSVELDPKNSRVRTNLGGVLAQLGRIGEALAMCKQAIECDPQDSKAYFNSGKAEALNGQMDVAIVQYRKALELDPNDAEAHCELGAALKDQGNIREALTEFRRGHELGSARPDWKYPSADWLREAEADVAKAARLQPKLTAFLEGGYKPSDTAERLEFASFCQNMKLNHAATDLYAAALEADPKIGENLEGAVRYNAACVAALSAAGRGEDSGHLGDLERARLRKQALDWLRADLNVAIQSLESGTSAERGIAPVAIHNLLHQADLSSLRDPAALAELPADEKEAFTQLWADMAALLEQARAPNPMTERAGAPLDEEDARSTQVLAFNRHGITLMSKDKFAEAEKAFADGVAACQRAFTGQHPLTAILLHHHADALRAQGRLDDALSEARRAVDMYSAHSDWAPIEAGHACSILASILTAQGRPDDALASLRELLALQRRTLPPGSTELSSQIAVLGLALVQRGTLETAREAEPLLRECLDIRLRTIPDDWRVSNTRSLLGGALLSIADLDHALTPAARADRLREAEPLLLEGYRGMKQREESIPPQAVTRVPEALERLVKLYEATGNAPEAAAWRTQLEALRATAPKPGTTGGK